MPGKPAACSYGQLFKNYGLLYGIAAIIWATQEVNWCKNADFGGLTGVLTCLSRVLFAKPPAVADS